MCNFGHVRHMLAGRVLGCDTVVWQIDTNVRPKCWYPPSRPCGVVIKVAADVETNYIVQNLHKLVLYRVRKNPLYCVGPIG